MAVSKEYIEFVNDQLSEIGEFDQKSMFGGVGFFREGIMFRMIGYSAFRLKVDQSNQADYENLGMKPFHSDSKKKGMPYWEVPIEVLEDKDILRVWANKSILIALS